MTWITEQKNTLSLAFYLAAALVYLRFDETRRPRLYAAAFALFVASMGCKTSTVTLPATLLVVFWWKRGQIGWRRDVLPLLPWLILGAAAGLFSSWVEQNYLGAKGENFDQPALARVLVAGRAIWFYAGNLIWPAGLNFVYPRWTVNAAVWWQWLFPLGVLAVGILLWTRGGAAAVLWRPTCSSWVRSIRCWASSISMAHGIRGCGITGSISRISACWRSPLPAAEKAFREALRLAPDNPFAQQALAAVLQETRGR